MLALRLYEAERCHKRRECIQNSGGKRFLDSQWRLGGPIVWLLRRCSGKREASEEKESKVQVERSEGLRMAEMKTWYRRAKTALPGQLTDKYFMFSTEEQNVSVRSMCVVSSLLPSLGLSGWDAATGCGTKNSGEENRNPLRWISILEHNLSLSWSPWEPRGKRQMRALPGKQVTLFADTLHIQRQCATLEVNSPWKG